jgi:hypothetical protein
MTTRAFILALVLALLAPVAALAAEVDKFNGTWSGAYRNWTEGGLVPFEITIRVGTPISDYADISGTIAEPATFGNKEQPWLRATIAGQVKRDNIEFVKTYDGTGGVNHSVNYKGTLDRDNGLIFGRYTISSGESEGFVIWLAH